VVTIGNFDGVHQGHQSLLSATVAKARELGVPALVFTFDPAPRDVLRPDNDVPRIQTLVDRVACLAAVGIDHVVVEPFTRELGARQARWFADHVIGGHLRAGALVVGWDFRFGAGRAGTVDDLRRWLDVPVDQVEAFTAAGAVASSSRIRHLVRDGAVAEAATLLTRPHRLRGTVVHGDARGRTLGFPTANIAIETMLRPAVGVYAVRVDLGDGAIRPAVANFGKRPTFGGETEVLEVHLLDFDGDLYGRGIAVDFAARIRGEHSFASIDALKARIAIDIASSRQILAC
jgi:riboflavin kinase/FMN adenylyltransferase